MGEESEKENGTNILDISALDVYPILGFFLNILNVKAWQYMGLRVDPQTQKIQKDFKKAILTIDCVPFIIVFISCPSVLYIFKVTLPIVAIL